MRVLRMAALLGSFVLLSAGTCPTNPTPGPAYSSVSVALSGPTTLPNDGPNATYTGVVTVTRTAGSTGAITLSSPFWLTDEDSPLGGHDRLSFVQGVTIPAGSSTATVTWDLGCRGRTVQGTALTLPGGSPNNPDSGEGNAYSFGPDSGPADLMVEFEGRFVSPNTVFVTCTCDGATCPGP